MIVFSHGSGANTEAYANVSRHWVSYGFITIHPQHADARISDGTSERAKLGGLKSLTVGISDRVRDVAAVLDALDELGKNIPDLKGKMDREHIGVSGHTYDAFVTMLIADVTIESSGKTPTFADPRVKCILPFSAVGTGAYGLTKDSWKKAELPVLYVTGTKDIRPGHDTAWRLEPFGLSPATDKHMLVIEGANHFSFGGGPAKAGGKLGNSAVASLVKSSSVAFWDAYLNQSNEAKAYLKASVGLSKFAGGKAKWSVK